MRQPGSSAEATGSVSEWSRKVGKACKDLASLEHLGKGELTFYGRATAFQAQHTQAVDAVQAALCNIHPALSEANVAQSWGSSLIGIKRFVTNATDQIDRSLDQHWATTNSYPQASGSAVAVPKPAPAVTAHEPAPTRAAAALASFDSRRPQDSFQPPDDNSNTPLVPDFSHLTGLMDTPPAQIALADADGASGGRGADRLARHAAQLNTSPLKGCPSATYAHPFAAALAALPAQYPQWQLCERAPEQPLGIAGSAAVYVDTAEALDDLRQALEAATEFAVDLEHSDRSYQGFTCLMQVSTRERDYIVDVLRLRSLVGPALARAFSDATTLKVMHGADRDIMWLQKDFGLFVVNMFDTGQAARLLSSPCGLGALLEAICGVKTDKSFQRADWRQRPLPADTLRYARLDTHYLLYIADTLRQRLLQAGADVPPTLQVQVPPDGPQGALGACYERSRQLCLQRYEKPLFRDSDYLDLYHRLGQRLSPHQLAAFAAVFAWRDRIAREVNDAPHAVVFRNTLLQLAKTMPSTVGGVVTLAGRKQTLLRERASEVVEAIKAAREQVPADATPLVPSLAAFGAGRSGSALGKEPDAAASPSSEHTAPESVPAAANSAGPSGPQQTTLPGAGLVTSGASAEVAGTEAPPPRRTAEHAAGSAAPAAGSTSTGESDLEGRTPGDGVTAQPPTHAGGPAEVASLPADLITQHTEHTSTMPAAAAARHDQAPGSGEAKRPPSARETSAATADALPLASAAARPGVVALEEVELGAQEPRRRHSRVRVAAEPPTARQGGIASLFAAPSAPHTTSGSGLVDSQASGKTAQAAAGQKQGATRAGAADERRPAQRFSLPLVGVQELPGTHTAPPSGALANATPATHSAGAEALHQAVADMRAEADTSELGDSSMPAAAVKQEDDDALPLSVRERFSGGAPPARKRKLSDLVEVHEASAAARSLPHGNDSDSDMDGDGLLGDVTTVVLKSDKQKRRSGAEGWAPEGRGRGGRRGRGRGGTGQAGTQKSAAKFVPFDYDAEAADALASMAARKRGRGGGRSDGRGRGRGRGRDTRGQRPTNGFNPFAIEEADVQAAPRSSSIRTGNKSATL